MEKPVKLFWTGGWDSSFRLLELLLVQQRTVQPYYLIDFGRISTPIEIKAIQQIRAVLFKKYPEMKNKLLPIIFNEVESILPNELISEQYKRLLALKHLGSQYDWLARYADENKIKDLELCIYTRRHGFFTSILKPYLKKIEEGNSINYVLEDSPENPDLQLFSYYKFPNHDLSKKDTEEIAKKNNFNDILEHTWFCHKPTNNKPCGLCNPCRLTIEQGLGRRVPLTAQFKNFIQFTIKPPIKKFLIPSKINQEKFLLGTTRKVKGPVY